MYVLFQYVVDSTEDYSNGVNSILFKSEETYGYCYLIHKFKIDEKIGESLENEFEFISIDGDKCIHKMELEQPYEENTSEITEEVEIENKFLDYYKRNFNN
ncbi:hypothetical protein CJ195_19055 [Bacillus sp. UMB0899]|nr:hypothetical protein CJ195_19055 [Bacillus sp. UMB0899]